MSSHDRVAAFCVGSIFPAFFVVYSAQYNSFTPTSCIGYLFCATIMVVSTGSRRKSIAVAHEGHTTIPRKKRAHSIGGASKLSPLARSRLSIVCDYFHSRMIYSPSKTGPCQGYTKITVLVDGLSSFILAFFLLTFSSTFSIFCR